MARPIQEIFNIFNGYSDRLREQEREAYRAIDDWHKAIITEIGNHTSKQRRLVREAFDTHETHLVNIRDQVLQVNSMCWKKNDTTEIDELVEKCRRMKVELVTINIASRKSEYIDVVPIKPPEQMYPEEYPATKTTDNNSTIKPMSNTEDVSAYNTQAYTPAAVSSRIK